MTPVKHHREPVVTALAVRRARCADLDALRRFLAGLSLLSAYRRFFAGVRHVPEQMLRRLVAQDDRRAAFVAVDGEEIVAHAMYAVGPDEVADIAVVVADAWQRRGIGPQLIETVMGAARARGVRRVGFTVLPENQPMRRLAMRSWPDATPTYVDGALSYQVTLPDLPLPQQRSPETGSIAV